MRGVRDNAPYRANGRADCPQSAAPIDRHMHAPIRSHCGALGITPPGILLATRLLVSRAGAPQGPISPTYQQAGAKMKKKRESFRCFLLLLFLAGEKKVEIRHGTVVVFDFVGETLLPPLAQGHCGRLSSSTPSSGRVHYSLICESAHFDSKRTDNDLATRVGTPRIHQRGASSPMPERWYI